MADDKAKKLEPSSNNDQLIRTVPGTDVGGHDTAGTDGEKRTERKGEILGTPNAQPSKATEAQRQVALDQADFVAKEVDRANREDLPRLGGDAGPNAWKPEEGGPPEFLSGAHVIAPRPAAPTTTTTTSHGSTVAPKAAPPKVSDKP